MYTVDWIGTVALGILQDGKPRFAMALEEGQAVPADFKVGTRFKLKKSSRRSRKRSDGNELRLLRG
jgi:hypothetical protein